MLLKESNLSTALRDSALLITAASVLFYTWGIYGDMMTFFLKGAPLEFFPESTIEERMLTGGMLGLMIFYPIVVLAYVVDLLTKGAIQKLVHKLNNARTLAFVSVYSGMFLLSILFVCLGTTFLTYFSPASKTQIISIRLADDAHRLTKYEGKVYVGRKGKNYIFADESGVAVYLLNGFFSSPSG
jgi:hypothetical protein